MDENEIKLQKIRDLIREDEVVFGIKWFKRHQKKLLWFLNTPIIKYWFRWVLRIRKEDCDFKIPIKEIMPSYFTIDAGKQLFNYSDLLKVKSQNQELNRFERKQAEKLFLRIKRGKLEDKKILLSANKTDFRTHDKYSKRLYFGFYYLWWFLHALDWVALDRVPELAKLSFGFSTLTAYPPSSGAPSSGYTRRNGVNETLSNIRSGAGTSAYGYDDYIQFYLESDVASTNQFYANYRGTVGFDTSSLTSGATISSATNGLYGGAEWTAGDAFSGTQPSAHTAAGGVNSSSSFSTSDYSQTYHGTTSFGSIAAGSWSGSGYNDITLNASGLSHINKTGNTWFSWVTSWDINNSFTGTWANYKRGGIKYATGVNYTGTSRDPKLVVTYTTLTLPTVTTQAVSSIDKTTATGNGNITNAGGENNDKRGFVYDTSSKSLPGNVAPGSSGYASYAEDTGSYGTGAFTKGLTGLSEGTTYYVRAYSHNSTGYAYGSEVSFKTDDAVQITKSLKYSVLVETSITKSLKYTVITEPSAITKSLKYTVVIEASAITKSLQYSVLTTPSGITKSLKYTVIVEISAITKSLSYEIITTPSAIQKSLLYAILTVPSALTKSLEYQVLVDTAITKSLQYTVEREVSAITKSLKYTVEITPSALTKSLEYVVVQRTSITKSLQYIVVAPVSITKSLKYTVTIEMSAITKSLVYAVRNEITAITKSMQYSVRSEASAITKSLKYTVTASASAITKDLNYIVFGRLLLQKSLQYSIQITPSAITKGLQYGILVETGITKSLKYVVGIETSVTKSLKYTVANNGIVITKSLQYAVLVRHRRNGSGYTRY